MIYCLHSPHSVVLEEMRFDVITLFFKLSFLLGSIGFGFSIIPCMVGTCHAEQRNASAACHLVWTSVIFVYSWVRKVFLSPLWLLRNLNIIRSTTSIQTVLRPCGYKASESHSLPDMDSCYLVRERTVRDLRKKVLRHFMLVVKWKYKE